MSAVSKINIFNMDRQLYFTLKITFSPECNYKCKISVDILHAFNFAYGSNKPRKHHLFLFD